MAVYPEHFLTENLATRHRFDVANYTLHSTWYFLKSADYTNIWVEWEQESQDGNQCYAYFEASDGITSVNSTAFNTDLLTWQNSVKKIMSLAGFNNVLCTFKLYVKGKGRVRGIVGLLT